MSGVKSLQVFIHLNLAPGMNEAKEYDTIEDFHQRDDKKYKQKIQETLHQINVKYQFIQIEVRKIAAERARE